MNIPKSEIEQRWQNVQQRLVAEEIDALLVPMGVNFYYLFGKTGQPSERLIAGVIPRDGEPYILAPSFEQSNMERSTGLSNIVTWNETSSPYKILTDDFKEKGIKNKLAVDPKIWFGEVEKIAKNYDRNNIISAGHILDELRSKKSEWELDQMKLASEYSAEGILAAKDQLKVGMTELEFMKIIDKEMTALSNNPSSFLLVQFGANSAIPHGMPSNKKLRNNEVVLIDCGTSVNGYHGDITITIPFGHVDEFNEVYEIVFNANRNALEADKPGFIPGDLDAVARDYITSKDYGKYFTHRLGHGLGLEVHEAPYIVGTNQTPLATGNTHTIEPGIYLPGKFGIRIEDDIFIGNDRAFLLYEVPRFN